uniref:Uncharacterized protein n=1 Tax=Physcomitrium patens TaxID=3218 RepID=A0A2K1IAC4_PHYPA|nr:hypothetical protein PHYPA_030801 [Physcomitrium patens]
MVLKIAKIKDNGGVKQRKDPLS